MAEFSIVSNDTPVGHIAVANIQVLDNGAEEDVDSVRVRWVDHASVTISDETWSGVDINTTGVHGETVTITDPTGTGNYKATIVIDDATYSPGSFPKGFSVIITITDTVLGSREETFTFNVVASSLDISLDPLAINTNVKRLAGLTKDVSWIATDSKFNRIDLQNHIVYDIIKAQKNGVDIVITTDYTHTAFSPYVTAVADVVAGDHFYFELLTERSDTYVDTVIQRHEDYLKSELAPYFDPADLAASRTFQRMVQDLSVADLIQTQTQGPARDSARFRRATDDEQVVMAKLKNLKRGGAALLGSTLDQVDRVVGSLVGGTLNLAASDIRTRQDILQDLQAWDSLVIDFTGAVEA